MVEYVVVLQPRRSTFGLGSIRFRSPLLTESISLSFPPLTEMFHFSGYCVSYPMYSGMNDRYYPSQVTPFGHPGSSLACSFPRFFAACRVLLRLLAPRHSPYALTYFIILQKFFTTPTIPQSPFVTYCIVFLSWYACFCVVVVVVIQLPTCWKAIASQQSFSLPRRCQFSSSFQ